MGDRFSGLWITVNGAYLGAGNFDHPFSKRRGEMNKQVSYSKIENEVRAHFRNNLNQAESSEDVRKFFAYAVRELIDKAFEGEITFHFGDIELASGQEQAFLIHQGLLHDLTFMNAWHNSDLHPIIERMAVTAAKHLKHFDKMPDKTEAKMFPTPSRGGSPR